MCCAGSGFYVFFNRTFIPWKKYFCAIDDFIDDRGNYVKFARAKGVSTGKVLFGHALKNTLIPVVTVFGLQLGNLIAFTTITETIYAWPGIGKLLIDAVSSADRPIIAAYILFVAVMFVAINFVVDLLYVVIDPRIDLR